MRKYILIGFLILIFSLAAQNPSKPIQIVDFVWVTTSTDKTAIFVGDRVELRLEIVYPKDWGIEILTEDLVKDSIQASLPNLLVLEKAEVFPPIPWGDYEIKLKAVYQLFYPEKKQEKGIQFNPIKIRFKLKDEEGKEPRKEIEVYEIETVQFILAVNSTLSPTSDEPRDSKTFFGNFTLKAWVALITGFLFILFGISIPVRAITRAVKNKQGKKATSLRQLLKKSCRELKIIGENLNSQEFPDSLSRVLRNIIGIKAGLKASSMTVAEIKEKITSKDKELIRLSEILEELDNFRYNPEAKPVSHGETLGRVKKTVSIWITQETQKSFWGRIKVKFIRLIRKERDG